MKEDEDELTQSVVSETSQTNSLLASDCAYRDACTAGQAKNSENLQTLSIVLR